MSDNHFLPPGYRLGNYQIADVDDYVLGVGGFGVTYYAVDIDSNRAVAIKEYMPRDYAVRDGVDVYPLAGMKDGLSCEDVYHSGLKKFRDEGKNLAVFEHPHINQVLARFDMNDTAYLVLEYIHGEPLSVMLERNRYLEEGRLRRLLDGVLAGLEEVHNQRICHHDLKPSNIMLHTDHDGVAESAVLIDFGASRENLGDHLYSDFQAFTRGYAAIEQENPRLTHSYGIGPWTDLYALGMIAYRCITGTGDQDLINATARAGLIGLDRQDEDLALMVHIGKGRYPDALLKAVDWALEVDPQSRPQSVAEMREELASGMTVSPQLPPQPPSRAPQSPRSRLWMVWIALSLALLGAWLAMGVL